jgi:SAM-dependent methyltransferase
MNRIRLYFPLIGFVVPTVVVGYGFVIPRSCIAGVNELTVGFGTTILGMVFTYLAGQRAVLPKTMCTKPPLGVRIARAINRQAAAPSGWFGRLLGLIWPREHGRLNAEVLERLDVRPGDHVLEVGSGTGHALREVARRARAARVLGVDVSELMVELARARNRGEVEMWAGDIGVLPLGEAAFDRVFSVHCIYFWQDVGAVLRKLATALKPGGRLVLAFRPAGDDIPERFRDPIYRFPHPRELEDVLHQAGLDVESTSSSTTPSVIMLTAVRSR